LLTRTLVHDFFTQDPVDWSGGEESCAKRFIRSEGIGNFADANFGALTIYFCRFGFLQTLVQPPRCGINLPGRGKSLTKTTFIQRLNTKGGSAPANPATACLTTSDVGHQLLVPYSADYFFFRNDQ
jgi:Protein of unknown function (DUF3455)